MIVSGTLILTRKTVLSRDDTGPGMLLGRGPAVSPSTRRVRGAGVVQVSDSRRPTRRHHERHLLAYRAPSLTPAPAPVGAFVGDSRSVRVAPCCTHGQ